MSMIHSSWVALGERSSLSGAMANPRTDTSTATSRVTRTITTRPHHSFIPALGFSSDMAIVQILSVYVVRRAYQVRIRVSRTHWGCGGSGGQAHVRRAPWAAAHGARPMRYER